MHGQRDQEFQTHAGWWLSCCRPAPCKLLSATLLQQDQLSCTLIVKLGEKSYAGELHFCRVCNSTCCSLSCSSKPQRFWAICAIQCADLSRPWTRNPPGELLVQLARLQDYRFMEFQVASAVSLARQHARVAQERCCQDLSPRQVATELAPKVSVKVEGASKPVCPLLLSEVGLPSDQAFFCWADLQVLVTSLC